MTWYDTLIGLVQYGALGIGCVMAVLGLRWVALKCWAIYLQQNTVINKQHTEMIQMGERHAVMLDDVREKTMQALNDMRKSLDNNTSVMRTICERQDKLDDRMERVESGLRKAVDR